MTFRGAALAANVLIAAHVFSASTPARAFCLTDEDLTQVLVGAQLRSLGATIGVCMRKYPELQDEGARTSTKFKSTYRSELDENGRAATDIFHRHSANVSDLDGIYTTAQNQTIKRVEQYSLQQCKNSIVGLDLVTTAHDFSKATAMTALLLQIGRETIPKCAAAGQ
jgi:hypothetical protein